MLGKKNQINFLSIEGEEEENDKVEEIIYT